MQQVKNAIEINIRCGGYTHILMSLFGSGKLCKLCDTECSPEEAEGNYLYECL